MSVHVYGTQIIANYLIKHEIKATFLTFYRFRESRFLGYYKRKLSQPVYERRKEEYRKKVLQPLESMPTLKQRLEEENAEHPILDAKINIGFSHLERKVTIKDRLEWRKELAKRKLETITAKITSKEPFKIDLSKFEEEWKLNEGPKYLQNIATHYGIFSHLYDHGFFTPSIPLNVSYNYDDVHITPVSMGNIVEASEAANIPNVSFLSGPDELWTLILTNLDGHLLDTDSEYCHWFVGNIKGNEVKSGEVIFDYLRPFPMRGTGYHRLVFVLYKQDKKIDYSSLKKEIPCLSLKDRTFKTFNFYKSHEDLLTPIGLAFFQCIWDSSLTEFFHNVLNMREPVFEYIEPPLYVKPQEQYPHLQPFNIYLDRYRDPKEIKKEVLLKRLKMIHPFKEESPMPKYPCLHKPENYKYSWQKDEMTYERLRLGKYRDLRPHSVYPQEDDQYPVREKMN